MCVCVQVTKACCDVVCGWYVCACLEGAWFGRVHDALGQRLFGLPLPTERTHRYTRGERERERDGALIATTHVCDGRICPSVAAPPSIYRTSSAGMSFMRLGIWCDSISSSSSMRLWSSLGSLLHTPTHAGAGGRICVPTRTRASPLPTAAPEVELCEFILHELYWGEVAKRQRVLLCKRSVHALTTHTHTHTHTERERESERENVRERVCGVCVRQGSV